MNASTRLHDVTVAVARAAQQPFTIEPARIRGPQGDEVLVRVVATGLCHTDLIVRDQYYPVPLPAVLGHEGASVSACRSRRRRAVILRRGRDSHGADIPDGGDHGESRLKASLEINRLCVGGGERGIRTPDRL